MNQTHKEKFEAYVRERCPELLKLSFGCEVLVSDERNRREFRELKYIVTGKDRCGCHMTRVGGVSSNRIRKEKIRKIIGHPIPFECVLKVLQSLKSDGCVWNYHTNEKMELVLRNSDRLLLDIPLTPPSTWGEETFEQLNKLLDI